jgi:hypothetical protein
MLEKDDVRQIRSVHPRCRAAAPEALTPPPIVATR